MPNKYYCQDITFCKNGKCTYKECARHKCHIRWDLKPYHSFADFKGTKYCPKEGDNNG